MPDIFTVRVIEIIGRIPPGTVSTYGLVARYAGNSSGARQVVRILHSSSAKYDLPWHRVVNREGRVSPRASMGHLIQRELLESEGVVFGEDGRIDMARWLWRPEGRLDQEG